MDDGPLNDVDWKVANLDVDWTEVESGSCWSCSGTESLVSDPWARWVCIVRSTHLYTTYVWCTHLAGFPRYQEALVRVLRRISTEMVKSIMKTSPGTISTLVLSCSFHQVSHRINVVEEEFRGKVIGVSLGMLG